jgi:hypothetical protein
MQEDYRLVQTAVLGHRDSELPVLMPFERNQALKIRRRFHENGFWCGIQLGGCGRQLSDRIGMEKVPHFAHYPDPSGRPIVCHRTNLDESSADHLYINEELTAWLRRQGVTVGRTQYAGDLRRGGSCTRLTMRVPDKRVIIAVQLAKESYDDWRKADDYLSREGDRVEWIAGPDSHITGYVSSRYGCVRRVRCETEGSSRVVTVATETNRKNSAWTSTSQWKITSNGILTPGPRAEGVLTS